MLKLRIECGNAAFSDHPGEEIARIMRALADKMQSAQPGDELSGVVRDINGNFAGEWTLDLSDE